MSEQAVFSIVVPVYQNELNLNHSIPTLLQLGQRLPGYELDLVFVDDGSTDLSYNILLKWQEAHTEQITVVKLTRNFGQNPAIREGLKVVRGDCVGIISADMQDPPEIFLEMIERWERGAKLVVAERESREERTFGSFVSNMYWRMVSRYAIPGLPKGGFDYCLFDRQIRDDLVNLAEKNSPIFPLVFWLGYDHAVIPYRRRIRTNGKSQWTLSKKIKITVDTFISFTYLPVRFVTILGLIASILSVLYAMVVFIRWLGWGIAVPGWATIVMLISMFGGMILFSLGIVGEYLWRILDEARCRPGAVVDSIRRGRH
ncbi:MAG: glycosyltransferase family 2 protein [Desulfovibrionales bacterium]|nr:glycosyltransferase family 2 protein [Desulfovibrionales bacterium]